ncbi:pimeloyl-ACP methyl ester carboxylesterase [Microbacterium resistens]|uniref:Pimeloyl-ACP methyl ester carboxylesterase n=1 Tax=Microbacterium resistens TaxID=156977 RepID=A0ABU1SDG6_9MICO|nr:alpha/beta hydrolase [Microbacterium resistens]MDR6867632.1 pimeloyl-ACP methyl ester carboxylesterase [Microbacterium resistens]
MKERSTSRRIRRIATVVAGLAVASVTLSGCLYAMIPSGSPASQPQRTTAPDTSGVSAELMPFYSQELSWSDCGAAMQCTDVRAPLDWGNPSAGELSLAVVRHLAPGDPKGSLLLNPGGPGASGAGFVQDSLDFAVGPDLIDQYDIVGFDPRGVGRSTAVTCLDDAEKDAYLYSIPSGARGSDERAAAQKAANQGFADACVQNSDGILPFITTVNSARDMDLLRGVLGDKKLNYLGYSYGTFLGATYADLYPDRVGHLVLDGAIDPAVSGADVSTTQALGFESALRAYMESCLADKGCPFNGTVDEAMADLGALLASVDSVPLQSGDGRMLGADSLMTAIISALYSQDSWSYLTQALTDALGGDPSTAFFLADFYNGRESGRYIDNSAEAFRAYNCMDYPVETDPALQDAAKAKIAAGAPTIAPYWEGSDPCEVWPYPPTGTRGPIAAAGSGPILVVGTTNDPATPYDWSVSLADQLQDGVLITRVGEGHTGYNKGNECVDGAVDSFFLDDTVPQDGLRCE